MKGCIQKKGKTYYAIIAINQKRKWFRGGQAQKDAQRALIETLNEINQGTYKEIPKTKFREFSRTWLKTYAEVHVKTSTLARYRDIINRLLIPAWGHVYLSNLTAIQIQNFLAERLKAVSPQTVSIEIGLIKGMFKHACHLGYIKVNPSEHTKRPRVTRAGIEILKPEEIAKLLAEISGRYRLAFLTCILTGLRAGELWALRWPDIDFQALQIDVRQSLWRGQFQTPKSKSSMRRIDIPEKLAHEIEKWRLASRPNDQDLVFPNTQGRPACHDNVVKRHFEPALKRAGFRHVSFHSLRHTNASMRISAGQNIKYIQTQLGHSSIQITLDIYGHLFNDANFNREQVRLLETSLESVRASANEAPLLIASASSI